MWSNTNERYSGLEETGRDAALRYESPTPEMIRHYIREGERLRAEAIADFWQRSFAALRRGFVAARNAVLIDTIHPGRHA